MFEGVGKMESKLLLVVVGPASAGPLSGAGEIVRQNARAAQAWGWDVVAAIPDGDILSVALAPHCSRIVSMSSSFRKKNFGRGIWPLAKLLRSERPTVVHFHVPDYRWGMDAVLGTMVARAATVLRTEHNPVMAPPPRPIRLAIRAADACTDRFVYVSIGNQRRFESTFPWRRDQGVVLTNVLDAERVGPPITATATDRAAFRNRLGLSDDAKLAVFSSGHWNLDDEGGRRPIGPVLQAMAGPELAEWHLAVIGNGDVDATVARAASLGLTDRLHFLGRVTDAYTVVRNCDLFVCASHYEGCSVAFLEAWYFGVPLLAAEVDGVEDVTGVDDLPLVTARHGDTARFRELWRQADDPDSPFRLASRRATETVRSRFTVPPFEPPLQGIYRSS
jgi:glycosyltransferase involved in cell wall biosynthesis